MTVIHTNINFDFIRQIKDRKAQSTQPFRNASLHLSASPLPPCPISLITGLANDTYTLHAAQVTASLDTPTLPPRPFNPLPSGTRSLSLPLNPLPPQSSVCPVVSKFGSFLILLNPSRANAVYILKEKTRKNKAGSRYGPAVGVVPL